MSIPPPIPVPTPSEIHSLLRNATFVPLYITQKQYASQWRKVSGYEFYQKMSEVSYAYNKLKLADTKCLPELLDQLSDPNDAIRAMVAEILWRIDDDSAIEPLENALAVETNAQNKKIMAISLDILRGVDVSEKMTKEASYHTPPDDMLIKKKPDSPFDEIPIWMIAVGVAVVVLIIVIVLILL